jgi:hypothetical protein
MILFLLFALFLVIVIGAHNQIPETMTGNLDLPAQQQSRVAIATMVTKQPDFQHWLDHHMPLVDRIYLRVENAPEIVEMVRPLSAKIYFEVVNDGEMAKQNNYFTMMDRQHEFITRMLQQAKDEGIDYLFHIDADELISSQNGDLRSHLDAAPAGTACIHFKNFEAVFNNNKHCFDAAKFMDCQSEACTSYANGKSAAVIKNGPTYNGPHYFHGKLYDMPDDKIRILHFDSCTYEAWKQKFARLSKSKTSDIPLSFYKKSIDLMAKNPTEQQMQTFYRQSKWK